jgi:hypothetical protein
MADATVGVRTQDNLVDPKPPRKPTKAELLELVEKMQKDWVQLNAFLNATAVYFSWCSDWESRVSRYNRDFRVLKLEGRPSLDHGRSADPYLLPPGEIKRVKIKDVQFEGPQTV